MSHERLTLRLEAERRQTLSGGGGNHARVPLPCVHVGDDAGPKGWHLCEREDEPLGAVVCTCKGCGPRCPGYEAKGAGLMAAAPDLYGPITPYLPPPSAVSLGKVERVAWKPVPPPTVRPTRDRLVITVATGEEGKKTHALTAASHRRYAERAEADYVVLADTTQAWFMLEKFRYGGYVPHYHGGTLCIDADVWVSRSAPDLFAEVPPETIGVSISDDLHSHGLMPGFNQKLREVCQSQAMPVPAGADRTHWNSGLVLVRPKHAGYWTPPARPLPKHWISEELLSKAHTFRAGWALHNLPHPTVHWQHWRDQNWRRLGPPIPPFVHPAGLTQQPEGLRRRLDLFRALEASGA